MLLDKVINYKPKVTKQFSSIVSQLPSEYKQTQKSLRNHPYKFELFREKFADAFEAEANGYTPESSIKNTNKQIKKPRIKIEMVNK
jgi:hypothetical protein